MHVHFPSNKQTEISNTSFTSSDFRKLDKESDEKFKDVKEVRTVESVSLEQTSDGNASNCPYLLTNESLS